MYSLNQNTIDFLSRYCKSKQHKNCHGNWTGLGLRVGCCCLCHNNNRNSSENIHYPDSINTLNHKDTSQDTSFSNSKVFNQHKVDDIDERDEATKLHLSQYHLKRHNLVSDIAVIVKGGEEQYW